MTQTVLTEYSLDQDALVAEQRMILQAHLDDLGSELVEADRMLREARLAVPVEADRVQYLESSVAEMRTQMFALDAKL